MSTLKEHVMQAPLELYYTSVPMNVLKATLTNRLKYRYRRKENSDMMNLFFIQTPDLY